MKTLYISSLESERFRPVRKVTVEDVTALNTAKPALIVQIEGKDGSTLDGVSGRYVLIDRHAGYRVDKIETFPHFVFVCALQSDFDPLDELDKDHLSIIAWGELYDTPAIAKKWTGGEY
ncbi:hypothetical protein [Aliiroseovarius crassostreae]|uniref:hypothetical protein n=1 Tax=Aliiroseovarius crassostreae TaxID=154981 RepID=UPI00220BD746|nr:hypothetical protein [Aliiroseovarius crassostreae]UWQ06665.1 hypothetical protein K3X22_15355 [Aliiroseovarius crassostreae]